MTVALMWEARAVEGRGSELLAWVGGRTLPRRPLRREVLTAPGDRVLVITWWDDSDEEQPPELPEPPTELLTRPVHRWRFSSVEVDGQPAAHQDYGEDPGERRGVLSRPAGPAAPWAHPRRG